MKVLIPTAGKGTRLGDLTSYYNKAMLPIGRQPVISYIIDQYPPDTEYVVALGYKGEYIRQYWELAYPKTKVAFVIIDNFDGPGSGLGYTIKQCKPYLDQEFMFHANDSIVLDKVLGQPMEEDTMFLSSEFADPKRYRTVSVEPDTYRITGVYDKTETPLANVLNYIGVAYIKEWKEFVRMLDDISERIGESDYFMHRVEKGIRARIVDRWYDIGNVEQLRLAVNDLAKFHSLSKPDEAIYFREGKVYKFSVNEGFIQRRVERASLLSGLVPEIVGRTKNFYVYDYISGKLLSEEVSVLPEFRLLLSWSRQWLWKAINLNQKDQNRFENTCFGFYYDKTMDRLDEFYSKYDFKEEAETINGIQMPNLSTMLDMVDWSDIKRGVPVLFHGDYHFENILRTETEFKLLDWRQGFGDEIKYGDLYYDLAKLLHGLIINHSIIRNGQFVVQSEDGVVQFDFHRKNNLIECETYYREFIKENGWSWDRTRILTALIFLNIASLHHYPYSHLLYYLGKSMLWKILNGVKSGSDKL